MRHVIFISGKDSLATALTQRKRQPDLTYEYVFNPTGWDLPETLEWISKVQDFLGQEIIQIGDDLTEVMEEQGWLPTTWRRYCTRLCKIQPTNDYLGKSECMMYYGLRADEPDRVGLDPLPHQHPVFPLREEGVDLQGVWKLCISVDLVPPQFQWAWLEDRVRHLLGSRSTLIDQLDTWNRWALFAWRSRSNCDRCFNARLYEKVGLLEHHPQIFWEAVEQEERIGGARDTDTSLTWHPGYSLRSLAEPDRRNAIRERRAKEVARFIEGTRQRMLFGDEEFTDILSTTSCGLLCGK